MNRPNNIQKAKSLALKYNQKVQVQDEDYDEEDYDIGPPKAVTEKSKRQPINVFDKINKLFDDPTIKNLKDFDHDDFLNKENDEDDSLPQIPGKTKSKSMQSGKQVLEKAKQLLEKNKDDIPMMKEKAKKKKVTIQQKQSKENTFVTGLGLYQEKNEEEEEEKPEVKEKEKIEEDDDDDEKDDEQYEDFDENEYLKKLQAEELDDLEELRRMIAKTKKEIQGYAGEVYQLKNSISDLNLGYRGVGYGVDEDLFSEMDREFNRFMPGGDTNKLFDNFDNKLRSSQPILSTAKKGVKKNTFMSGPSSSSNSNSISGSTSQSGIRKPPIVRQPVLEKAYGTSKMPELLPISNNKKQMRETFY
ncbi:hypothetical protein ABPG74_015852 [Tetrahymena malaccensis]